jgi:predicted dehydrogenase
MAEILRIGFAGLGEAATRVLPQISKLPIIKLAAAADLRRDALERFREEFKAEVYPSIEEMCQSPNVDVVYVGTPHELHAQHTLIALQNRKHVIVEKPMALTIEDCEKMNAAAEKYGVKLLCGHTKSFNPPNRKMREIVKSGELGKLCMINTWNYNDFMVRPYPDHELAMSRGVVLNQGPHQVDVVRQIGGGMVRSVRGTAGRWDPSRPGEGAHVCYLEFEDGVPATLVYSGYGFFDTSELHSWLGEGGQFRHPDTNVHARRSYKNICGPEKEKILEQAKEQLRYGAGKAEGDEITHGWEMAGYQSGAEVERRGQPFFGPMIVTCERGEMRQSEKGIIVYGDQERREIALDRGLLARQAEMTELYEAVVNGRPMFHDGRWGEATLEVCLAILQSAAERREIFLSHQVPVRD